VHALNTKTLAAVVVFTALAIALNLSPIKIPAPFAPYLIYQIWEIPIVTAFLLFGAAVGVSITIVNTLALFAFFPGALPTGPMYNMAAVLSMLLGIGLTKIILKKRFATHETVIAVLYTASGVILRSASMAIVNYSLLRFPPPVGYSFDEAQILLSLPLVTIFNLTLALYTIPIGYSLAKILESSLKKSSLDLNH
jgi:riboflavin transporter FmnP